MVVLAPRGQVEWGGTDPQVNWVARFEADTGCKVTYRPFAFAPGTDQSEALDPGAFDVIAGPPDLAGLLVAEQRVTAIDTERVTGYGDIPKRLRDVAGTYGVPYLWDRSLLLYDSGKVKPRKAEALYADAGPVLIKDTPLSIADVALRQDASDPYQLTTDELDAAVAVLERERESAERVFWRDPFQVASAFATGSARLAQGTPYLLDALRQAGKPVKALPERRVTGTLDSWLLSAEAAHPTCAYQWLAWAVSPRVQRAASAWNGLAPANPKACKAPPLEPDPSKLEDATAYPRTRHICSVYSVGTTKAFKNLVFASYPTEDCSRRDDPCASYAQWVAHWARLTS